MSDNKFLSGKTAVVGLGATEFSKDSGRSEIQLGVEAISMALADAGLSIDEVDGMASYTMDNNPEIELYRLLGGKELKFFSRTHYGGGAACGPLLHAAMAVATGSRIGVMIRISGAMSIRVPSTSSKMLIISSTTYLLVETLVNKSVICCGICISVMM